MPQSFPAIFGRHHDRQIPPTFIGKVVLWIAVFVSLLLMYWFATTFSIPSQPGFTASLIQQNAWVMSFIVTMIGMVVVMFASATLTSGLRTETPVFCTAIACAVISWRGGTMQSTLFDSSTPRIFIALAVETAILFAALVGVWMMLCKARGPRPPVTIAAEDEANEKSGLDEKLLATFTQAATMMAMLILLCRSDAKNQVLASVAISAAVASAIAVQLVKVRSSFWLWIGPVAVAVFGYVFSTFHSEGWQAGLLHGPLAALARPLPLDYLSMGTAGAILGYWLSNPFNEEEEIPDVDAPNN